MLDLCASYAMDTYYPEAPSGTAGTFATLAPLEERRTRYAEGATGIPGGSIELTIFRDASIGVVETQGQAIMKELSSLSVGLAGISPSSGLCSEAGPSLTAGGESRKAFQVTVSYGLNS